MSWSGVAPSTESVASLSVQSSSARARIVSNEPEASRFARASANDTVEMPSRTSVSPATDSQPRSSRSLTVVWSAVAPGTRTCTKWGGVPGRSSSMASTTAVPSVTVTETSDTRPWWSSTMLRTPVNRKPRANSPAVTAAVTPPSRSTR